jgi:hypothetical protein
VELDRSLEPAHFLRSASQVIDIQSLIPHETSLDEVFVRVVSEVPATAPEELSR